MGLRVMVFGLVLAACGAEGAPRPVAPPAAVQVAAVPEAERGAPRSADVTPSAVKGEVRRVKVSLLLGASVVLRGPAVASHSLAASAPYAVIVRGDGAVELRGAHPGTSTLLVLFVSGSETLVDVEVLPRGAAASAVSVP